MSITFILQLFPFHICFFFLAARIFRSVKRIWVWIFAIVFAFQQNVHFKTLKRLPLYIINSVFACVVCLTISATIPMNFCLTNFAFQYTYHTYFIHLSSACKKINLMWSKNVSFYFGLEKNSYLYIYVWI